MKLLRRRQVMIDQEVQGALIGRVILYWFACQLTILLADGVWQWVTLPADQSPARIVPRLAGLLPALLGASLGLPLVIADVLRLSNRFVGPTWNLRNAMKRLELGDSVPPLELRRGDFWHDLLRRFNRLCLDRHSAIPRPSEAAPPPLPIIDPAGWDAARGLPVAGVTFAEPTNSD